MLTGSTGQLRLWKRMRSPRTAANVRPNVKTKPDTVKKGAGFFVSTTTDKKP